MLVVELVRARVVEANCPDCRNDLLLEAQSCGGLPLAGEFILIPRHWLDRVCPHGRSGLTFAPEADVGGPPAEAEQETDGEVEVEVNDSRIDATKNIGYPVREHGPYGSHPMHDDFDDESGPDGSGTY